jgi:XTP/dITP diphosphohydrolase
MKKIVFATNNLNKLQEVREILKDQYQVIGLKDLNFDQELAEDGDTFEKNALQKAKFIAEKFKIACFAEDAGLEVQALNQDPGVFSARYAGNQRSDKDNIALLLKNLEGIKNRKARFKAVIALVDGQNTLYFDGIVNGRISLAPTGSGGFGYDPVFIPDGYEDSFAQLGKDIKNSISHRAKAIKKLIDFLDKN